MFEDIEDASSFWRELWETRGSGNEDAAWLQEMEDAIARRVPPPPKKPWQFETSHGVRIILKKRNWSAPGPDKLVNYWWKRAHALHDGVTRAFLAISESEEEYPGWFTEGKTSLLPKPGDFCGENQRPITFLNNTYKWFTSCLQSPMPYVYQLQYNNNITFIKIYTPCSLSTVLREIKYITVINLSISKIIKYIADIKTIKLFKEKIRLHLKNWKYTNSKKMTNNKRLLVTICLVNWNIKCSIIPQFSTKDLGGSRLANL